MMRTSEILFLGLGVELLLYTCVYTFYVFIMFVIYVCMHLLTK